MKKDHDKKHRKKFFGILFLIICILLDLIIIYGFYTAIHMLAHQESNMGMALLLLSTNSLIWTVKITIHYLK